MAGWGFIGTDGRNKQNDHRKGTTKQVSVPSRKKFQIIPEKLNFFLLNRWCFNLKGEVSSFFKA